MSLISLHDIRLAFGGHPVLDGAALQVREGERICLLGRNGEGKSSLLRLIAGQLSPDGGTLMRRQGLKVGFLPQEVPADGAGEVAELVARAACPGGEPDWTVRQRAATVINRLHLRGEDRFEALSGGYRRRVLLACALMADPELLVLDEPTNHLDLESIAWLEEFLRGSGKTLLFISHDRAFIRALATRLVELDRGRLFNWDCDYATYLQRRQEWLQAEDQQSHKADRKLAQEEAWIRQGVKARRTRNEGRVRALERLRQQRQKRRERQGKARMVLQEAERSGRLVAELENVSFAWGDRPILRDFSTTLLRGDRVGIIGPNGSGKTTLLRLLLGELAPQRGRVRLGTGLEVIYFDQFRQQLDENLTVQEAIADGADFITLGGVRRHVIGYLQDFLFSPERARTPVRVLSGGERNRLLLARLFTRPANVLVLDEPTNDLDMDTLELLEQILIEFEGTVLLVSHDRAFLDDVVTSTLVLEGEGRVEEYPGGYEDWLRQRPAAASEKKAAAPPSRSERRSRPEKMSFREKRELEELPGRIEALEAEQEELHRQVALPEVFRDHQRLGGINARLRQLETELAAAYQRWQELDERAAGEEA